jgi:hypothetical protein
VYSLWRSWGCWGGRVTCARVTCTGDVPSLGRRPCGVSAASAVS